MRQNGKEERIPIPRSDYWTHVVVAVVSFLVTLPALLSPWQGTADGYKVLFIIGPLLMLGLAWWGRRQAI